MFYYWYRILRILLSSRFQQPLDINQPFSRTYRVRLFDCDGLRVMTASRYPAYMDFIRWELLARTRLYHEIVLKRLAPTLGSQKLIYRRPLKRWTRFTLHLETAGWDEKWMYHIHRFEQSGEIKAIGITRALIWRKDKPQVLRDILSNAGVDSIVKTPPEWVLNLFKDDAAILTGKL